MISIVVLTKSESNDYLKQTLDSILRQTEHSFKLLLLTPFLIKEIKPKKISDQLTDEKYLNQILTNNGIKIATSKVINLEGDYFIPVNEGDLLVPKAIEIVKEILKKDGRDKLCARAYYAEFDSGNDINSLIYEIDKLNNFNFITQQKNCRRLLFGFPISINMGKFYCLHRKVIEKFVNQSIYKLLRDDAPEVTVEMKDAIWIEKILYLKQKEGPCSLKTEVKQDENLFHLKKERKKFIDNKKEEARKKKKFAQLWIKKYNLPLNLKEKDEKLIISPKGSVHSIDIEITNHCNAHCIFCPNDKIKEKGFMKKEVFFKIINKIKEANISFIMFIGRGEPILHPHFLEFVRHIKENSGAKLEVFTNGYLLSKKLIDELAELNDEYLNLRINVSLHSLKINVHDKLVGLSLKVIADNLKYLMKHEKVGHSVCFVKNKINEDEMNQLRRYFDKIGVKNVDISLIYNKGGHIKDSSLFSTELYLRNLSKENIQLWKKRRLCHYTYDHVTYFLNYRGEFVLCQEDFDDKLILGNIFDNDFDEIFEKVEAFKKAGGSPQCRRCNKLLHDLFHGDDVDPEAQIKDVLIIN